MSRNPYSVLFGKEPTQNISRFSQANQILESFLDDSAAQPVYMITGVRGSGKTVFMTDVTSRMKAHADWVIVELSSEGDLLEKLASALASEDILARIFQKARINLSFFGFGLEVAGIAPISNIEIALQKMLESLKKHNKKVLVTIDEAISSQGMRTFAGAFQLFIRQNLPVYLLMTGLYENIEELQNEKNLTFLYRAPKIYMKPLNIMSIAENYQATLLQEPSTALHMAKLTMGYPLAFQVLGYLTWENAHRFQESILSEYRQYLEDYAYDIIWAKLSKKDKQIAHAIALSKTGKISEIRSFLGIDTNQFNPYRKRLIKKGIISGEEWGYVRFNLPLFDSFVLSNYIE